MREQLTFDDISIIPKYSEITSRQNCNTEINYAGMELTQPLIASPMDTVCGFGMAKRLGQLGGLGIIHRFDKVENQMQDFLSLEENFQYLNGSTSLEFNLTS